MPYYQTHCRNCGKPFQSPQEIYHPDAKSWACRDCAEEQARREDRANACPMGGVHYWEPHYSAAAAVGTMKCSKCGTLTRWGGGS